jgi:steroid delta-isomerase
VPTPQQRRTTIHRYVEAHTAGDLDGILACFAPDATVVDPVGSEPHHGSDALRAFFEGSHALADRLELRLTGPIRCAGDDEAAFPMQAVSTIGELTVTVDIIDVMRFDPEGRVTEMRAYWSMEDARTT